MHPINLLCIKYVMVVFISDMQGLVSEDSLKDCTSRLFMVRMRLGEFDPPDMNPYKKYVQLTAL